MDVFMGGVCVPSMIDTGSMVTLITESFFKEHFECKGKDVLQECGWLTLKAANGLSIPYLGYLELDVKIMGKILPKCGVLVVKDPTDPVTKLKRKNVPGLVGMNIIKDCSEILSGPLNLMPPEQCPQVCQGFAKVMAPLPILIPAGSMCLVPATGFQNTYNSDYNVLVEGLEVDEGALPGALMVSPGLVKVQGGQLAVPIINASALDISLAPHTRLARLHAAEVVAGGLKSVSFQNIGPGEVQISLGSEEALVLSQEAGPIFSHDFPFECSLLESHQVAQVKALLNEYADVFAFNDDDLGCTSLIQHEIPVTDDVPIRQRYRRLPPSQYEEVKAHIRQLLEQGVISESCSPYSSPLVIVKKKDGNMRMCVDYRQLNLKTRKDAYPLPRIEESLDALSGAQWFSTLDLASGYNQVEVAEKDRQKTAFCTPFGLYQFNRMPFGLCNAPGTFQ
ncbi:uncharacterized protein [Misgurnus anguillicaudatus]|uniref:uncharacterized protein isoform X1 n=1 Tax=Misgurnus anguillicaudatus TaxID=75329 RepID=UPI003CCF322F